MKLIGLMPVRNEDWILGLSAHIALQWCDELAIGFHSCTDRSEAVVGKMDRIHRIEFRGGHWDEMKHRDRLLARARAEGATHIAMIDADEVLTSNLLDCIRPLVEDLGPGQMLELPGYNLRNSLYRYHSNGVWANRWFSCAFKDDPALHWSGDKFHSRNPDTDGAIPRANWRPWRPIKQREGGILHLWGASEKRLVAKHALYKVVERLRFEGKSAKEIDDLYNLAIKEPTDWRELWTFAAVPVESWWAHQLGPGEHRIDLDGDPWQAAEVRRLVAEHGRDRFAGLDLFGVA